MKVRPSFFRRLQQRTQLFGYRLRKSIQFKVGVSGLAFSELVTLGIEIRKPKTFFRRANQPTQTQFLCTILFLLSLLVMIDAIRQSLKIDK